MSQSGILICNYRLSLISVIDLQCSLSVQFSSMAHNLKGHVSFFPPNSKKTKIPMVSYKYKRLSQGNNSRSQFIKLRWQNTRMSLMGQWNMSKFWGMTAWQIQFREKYARAQFSDMRTQINNIIGRMRENNLRAVCSLMQFFNSFLAVNLSFSVFTWKSFAPIK